MTPSAAYVGAFGLEIQLTPGCGSPDFVEITPPPDTVQGIFEACATLDAGGVEVVGAGAELIAGERIGLEEGFTVALGSQLTAVIDSSLEKSFVYTFSSSPAAETSYKASFYVRLDDLPLDAADALEHLTAASAGGEPQFRLLLSYDATLDANTLALAARRDDGSWQQTAAGQELPLAAGWNRIELDWLAAAGAGHLLVAINGQPFTGLLAVDNGAARVDEMRWGLVGGALAATTGAIQLDDFASWR